MIVIQKKDEDGIKSETVLECFSTIFFPVGLGGEILCLGEDGEEIARYEDGTVWIVSSAGLVVSITNLDCE
jgi:hypothetical protein